MKKLSLFIAMAFVATLFSAPSLAAGMQHGAGMQDSAQMHSFYRADDLMDKDVVCKDGEKVGQVKDILLGQNGEVKYLLLSKAEGDELVAVPWSAIQSHTEDTVKLSLAGSRIENAPVFSEQTFSREWEQRVNAYYEGGTEFEGREGAEGTNGELEREGAAGTSDFESEGAMEREGEVMECAQLEGELSSEFLRASNFLDQSVIGPEGEKLGDLHDIIIGPDGQTKFAILAFGGFLGIGEEQVAVPWSMIQPSPEQDALMANVSQETLEQAPTFDAASYSPEWEREVNAYYGGKSDMEKPSGVESGEMERSGEVHEGESTSPFDVEGVTATEGAAHMGFLKTSDFMNKSVTGSQGEKLGEVEDLILGKDGKISYLLLTTDTTGSGEFVVVPWQIVRVEPEAGMLSLMVAKEKLDNAPKLTDADLEKINDPNWTRQIHTYYGIEYKDKDSMHKKMDSKDKMHEGSMMEKGHMEEKSSY